MNQWPAQILVRSSFFMLFQDKKTDHFFKVQHVKTTMLEDDFFWEWLIFQGAWYSTQLFWL